jgi:hypothetical protein
MKNIRFAIILLIFVGVFTACRDKAPVVVEPDSDEQSPAVPDTDSEGPAKYETSKLWTEFLSAKQAGTGSTLLDFSYAGYKHGEKSVPDVKYKIFKVEDYGAIPNDGKSDRQALINAINAAKENGNGIILFPAGRFDLRPKDAPNESIVIDADNIVLRGAGCEEGGTEIFMEYPNQSVDGSLWNTPELISFRYVQSSDALLADITDNASRGDFSVKVSSTGGMVAGQRVFLKLKNNDAELIAQELSPYEADAAWTELNNNGVQIIEYHEIVKISGKTVTFKEPIMHSIDSRWGWTLHNHSCHTGTGVEDIAFVGNFHEAFSHHLNALHDSGYRLLTIWRQVDSWVRHCRFTDVSEALSVIQSANVSVLNCRITGNGGHSAIRSQASTGVFIGKVADEAGQFHSMGVSKTAIGTVLWRNTWTATTCFESHASQPRATLFDACRGGFMAAHSGGDEAAAPNHLRDLVLWNFDETDSGEQNFNLWQRNTRWVMPVIVGHHGSTTTFISTQVTIDEGNGTVMQPLSLYEAQLENRLGVIPQWINDLK